MGYAPFGGNSLARSDANVQYLDFFAYLKYLISGDMNAGYSFGKILGDSNIGIISYYLLSPFNLLIIFFDKANLHSFIDLTAAMKIGLAASTMCFYLLKRFSDKLRTEKWRNNLLICIFSVSYALSQWFISQSSNIMWLDGAYMLPLIMLGVHEIIYKNKSWVLSVTVGLTIIFNWYSAGIDCLFSILWFVFEMSNYYIEKNKKPNWRELLRLSGKYIFSMLLGIAISAIVFFPTIGAMSGSGRSQLEISSLLDISFRGNILSAIQNYSLGATSGEDHVSLFCGTLVALSILGVFITNVFNRKKKILYIITLTIILLTFYWNPGFMIFSLLKSANSFWYRYAYVAIFTLLFISVDYWLSGGFKKTKNSVILGLSAIFSIAILAMDYFNPGVTQAQYIYCTIFFIVLISIAIIISKKKKIGYVLLALIAVSELGVSASLQMKNFHTDDVYEYQSYTELTEAQINYIKNNDTEPYRISETTTRNLTTDNLTANYNEALAYNYWSLSSYTSAPDERQMTFLDKVGYLTGSVNMNIVDTSLLGIDSILGVKYILSPYYINGLVKTDAPTGYDNKKVYQNPYAMPLAFVYKGNDYDTETEKWTGMNSINPFEYQNRLFNKLNNNQTIYKHIGNSRKENKDKLTYTLDIPSGNYAIYANIPWREPIASKINLNNSYEIGYAMWLSPSALYVPTKEGDKTATVTITTSDTSIFEPGREQFYALDLDKLKEASDQANHNKPEKTVIKDGYAYFEVHAEEGDHLFTSIPINENWTIKKNGEEISPNIFASTFYDIPLSPGENKIEMVYKIKYQKIGIATTVAGILLTVTLFVRENKQTKKKTKD